jgi:hypothetical protein
MSKKRKISENQNSRNLLDKLVEQTFTLILSFIFTTALIGGCAYALFQFPSELNEINRELLEYDVQANQVNDFNEILDIKINGWLADESERTRILEITTKMASDISLKNLDPVFVTESLDWIIDFSMKISFERGKVKGYQIVGEVKQNLQRNFIDEYDFWINYLNETESILRNWNTETLSERDKRLESLQRLTINSMSNTSEIKSNITQLKSQQQLDLKILEQKTQELYTKNYVTRLKLFLSGSGVIVGLVVFFFLGKVALKKFNIIV